VLGVIDNVKRCVLSFSRQEEYPINFKILYKKLVKKGIRFVEDG